MEIYAPYDNELQECYECCDLKNKLILLSDENNNDEIFLICERCLMDALELIREENDMNEKEFDPPSLDYTFCIDPECNNECGRKMSKRLQEMALDHPKVSYFLICPAKDNAI